MRMLTAKQAHARCQAPASLCALPPFARCSQVRGKKLNHYTGTFSKFLELREEREAIAASTAASAQAEVGRGIGCGVGCGTAHRPVQWPLRLLRRHGYAWQR